MSAPDSLEGLFLLGDDVLRFVLSFLGVDMALPFACVSKSALRVTLLASGGELRTRKECFLETRDLCVYSREVGLWDKMVVDMSMESVFCFCAEKGLLQGVQFLHSLDPVTYKNDDACGRAARGGHIEVLQWLRAEGYPWDESVCWRAAEGGQLDTLKWLHAQSAPWDSSTIEGATKHGRLDIIEWAREQHPPCPWGVGYAYHEAAKSGHLHILKWLFAHGCPMPNGTGFDNPCEAVACGCGSIEVMQWLRAHDVPWGRATYSAAGSGHLDLLQWMYAQDPPPPPLDSDDLNNACEGCHLPTVQWMRSLDPPVVWDGNECIRAAGSGNVELVKWLREQGRPWSSRGPNNGLDCMRNAAEYGHLDMVQYLLAQGCEWSTDTCKCAARGGHLAVLQFLRSKQGPSGERKEVCPWNAQECHEAAEEM